MTRITDVDLEAIAEMAKAGRYADQIPHLQTAVFVMCGGGMLGRMAAEQPADFYIDSRVGRLPYPKKSIIQAVNVLSVIASAMGLDPHHMPICPPFHTCGVF